MISAQKGNLLKEFSKFGIDGIMNAANGKGPMGAGIAGAIKRAGGKEIQDNAYEVCRTLDPQEGQAYSTIAGSLEDEGIKMIIHAVTMKQPAGITSLEICRQAFESALELAEDEGIETLGCTALGTGVGGLDPREVAREMLPVAKNSNIDVVFMDFDEDFIDEIIRRMRDN